MAIGDGTILFPTSDGFEGQGREEDEIERREQKAQSRKAGNAWTELT
jgi:hypothetical protein